jgi:Zn-finger nucleic acid-binding protein
VWWRNELRCPECATTGTVSIMNARASGDLIIDHCALHGVWLDRGELSRVMLDPAVAGLEKLRAHLAALEPTAAQLAERRERWRVERDERARLAETERKRIETERAKRAVEVAEAEQKRIDAHRAKLAEAERLAKVRTELAQRAAAEARAEAERAADRAVVSQPLEQPQPTILSTPPVRDNALELARLQRFRDAAEERVSWLEARIDSLQHELVSQQQALVQARHALATAVANFDAERDR